MPPQLEAQLGTWLTCRKTRPDPALSFAAPRLWRAVEIGVMVNPAAISCSMTGTQIPDFHSAPRRRTPRGKLKASQLKLGSLGSGIGALVSDSTVDRWVVLLPVHVSLRRTEGRRSRVTPTESSLVGVEVRGC